MAKKPGPSVRRRQLGATLREFRQQAGMTLKDAADWLDMGESAVSKLEKARTTIKTQTVRALGQLYDLDASKVDYLLRLVSESNQRGWWTAYRDTVPEWFRHFVGLEADALDVWNYEAEHIPGLLQTPEYIEAITRATRPSVRSDEVTQSVKMRRERQARTEGDEPPRLHFFLNEAVLYRPVGTPEAWKGQLEHLVDRADRDHIDLRILPFSAGPHPAMLGSFVMMGFPEEDSPAFVYVEHDRGGVYQEDPGDIERYMVVIGELEKLALDPADSRKRLVEAAALAKT